MTPDPSPEDALAVAHSAIVQTREQLADVRRELAAVTGGASARAVLAELARELAGDLANYFDDLPMHLFPGIVRREGLLGRLWPRLVPHRVILGRYFTATVPRAVGAGWAQQYAAIHVLAMGADGALRRGTWRGMVRIAEGTTAGTTPHDWNSILLRRVPPRMIRMSGWTATPDPHDVADPGRVLAALTSITQSLAETSRRDLDLLQRFVGKAAP